MLTPSASGPALSKARSQSHDVANPNQKHLEEGIALVG